MGDAERGWKSGNRKRERRSPSDDEWRSDGGFACKTKIRVEWGRKVREEDSEARTGWKIRGCLRFVIYKRPFQEASFSSRPPLRHSASPPPIIWAPPPPFLLFIIIDTARLAGAIERRSRKSPTRFVFVAIQPGILHRSCHVQPYERCVLSSGRPFLERKFMSLAR